MRQKKFPIFHRFHKIFRVSGLNIGSVGLLKTSIFYFKPCGRKYTVRSSFFATAVVAHIIIQSTVGELSINLSQLHSSSRVHKQALNRVSLLTAMDLFTRLMALFPFVTTKHSKTEVRTSVLHRGVIKELSAHCVAWSPTRQPK